MKATMSLARESLYWPTINDHIKTKVANCTACLQNSRNEQRAPMQDTETIEMPYQTVSIGLMEVDNEEGLRKHYLITVDHYSDYFDIDEFEHQKASAVVDKCRKNFATHGVPQSAIRDNGRQFDHQTTSTNST
jgi:hypothetical protein